MPSGHVDAVSQRRVGVGRRGKSGAYRARNSGQLVAPTGRFRRLGRLRRDPLGSADLAQRRPPPLRFLSAWQMQILSLSAPGLCIGLWIRAKTVDQDERGILRRRAKF